MSWCARINRCGRLAAVTAIVIFAAGSVTAANIVTETAKSQSPVPAVAARGPSADTAAYPDAAVEGDTAATGGTAAVPSPGERAARASRRARIGGSLQHRVDVLSKALQLDARQRTLLLTILESQREAVSKIWSDPALLPAERTPATRAVQERTADQIRAILSEQQRQRYNPPKPQGAAPPSPNVEEWMRKQTQTQARQQQ